MLAFDCPRCGQFAAGDDEPGDVARCPRLCDTCRRAVLGADERHEPMQLFEPAPAPMPGQLPMPGA